MYRINLAGGQKSSPPVHILLAGRAVRMEAGYTHSQPHHRFPVQLAEEHVKEKVLARLQELPRD